MMAGGGATGGSAPPFFGAIAMLREFSPEDPDWTPPTYVSGSNGLTTIRDNGSMGHDLSAVGDTSGGGPPGGLGRIHYSASTINGQPGWVYALTSSPPLASMKTTSGTTSGTFSVIVVGRVDGGTDPYFTDAGTDRAIISATDAGNDWQIYNGTGLFDEGGTVDGDPHLFVGIFETNNLDLLIDGTSVASDTSGTLTAGTGFTLGTNYAVTSTSGMVGVICYAAMYDGDITADGDYSTWIADINTHYGL
jgi:hypothetical protein